jgi:class 3 adenylate cyclase
MPICHYSSQRIESNSRRGGAHLSQGTGKLIAIMFTDIAGYTAMMGEDEGKAVRSLELSRKLVRGRSEAQAAFSLGPISRHSVK